MYNIDSDPKRFQWINEGKTLIWSFFPNEQIESRLLWPIEDRVISVVTSLATTENLNSQKSRQFPFTGKFFRIYDKGLEKLNREKFPSFIEEIAVKLGLEKKPEDYPDYFHACVQICDKGAVSQIRPEDYYVLVTKKSVYRFERDPFAADDGIRIGEIIPEPDELDVFVPIFDGICNLGNTYASQLGIKKFCGGVAYVKVTQPAKLTIAELRERL